MQPVVTAIEINPEYRKEFGDLVERIRAIAQVSLGPTWEFVGKQAVSVHIGEAKVI